MQQVKISGIMIGAVAGDVESAPSEVKLFVDKVGLDFDSAKDEKATQEIKLEKADVTTCARKELRFVNFQRVQTLGIFIPGNLGGDEITKIGKLAILGETIMHSGLKRSAAEQESSSKADWLGKGIS